MLIWVLIYLKDRIVYDRVLLWITSFSDYKFIFKFKSHSLSYKNIPIIYRNFSLNPEVPSRLSLRKEIDERWLFYIDPKNYVGSFQFWSLWITSMVQGKEIIQSLLVVINFKISYLLKCRKSDTVKTCLRK